MRKKCERVEEAENLVSDVDVGGEGVHNGARTRLRVAAKAMGRPRILGLWFSGRKRMVGILVLWSGESEG